MVKTLVWTRLKLARVTRVASLAVALVLNAFAMLRATQFTPAVGTVYTGEIFRTNDTAIDNFTVTRHHMALVAARTGPPTFACAIAGGRVTATAV